MTDTAASLEQLALGLVQSLEPLAERFTSSEVLGLFTELGLQLPASVASDQTFASAVNAAGTAAGDVAAYAAPLAAAIEQSDIVQMAELAAQAVAAVVKLVQALENAAAALNQLAGSISGINSGDIAAFAETLVSRVLEFVAIEYLWLQSERLVRMLALLGLVELTAIPGDPNDPAKPAYIAKRLHPELLAKAVQTPDELFADIYAWGQPNPQVTLLLQRVADLAFAFGVPLEWNLGSTPPDIKFFFITIAETSSVSPPGIAFQLHFPVSASDEVGWAITERWTMYVNIGAELQPGVSLELLPPFDVSMQSPTAVEVATFDVGFEATPSDGESAMVLFGSANGIRLQAASVRAGVVLSLSEQLTTGSANADIGVDIEIHGGQLIISLTEADGFLQSFLGSDELTLDASGHATWSPKKGLQLSGAGIDRSFPIKASLGPVELDTIWIRATADGSGIAIEPSISGGLNLGPLAVAIERLGARASATFTPGNIGPLTGSLAFKPPDGLGLVLDAGVVTGGGFIECDAVKGQYAGVLELALESLSLTAIGLIQTKMADGTPLPGGFSLLVIISVEFVPFVELGFGFSLNGVGGFLGLNRTMNVDALRAGVHSGSLDDIMFPADPVGHAPQIIQELAGFFPAAPGRFLIGPMVQIQWGSPLPILTADLGVLVELPAPVRVAILGVLQIGLPQADEDAVVLLNLDVLGVVDFGLGTLSLDASLFGSRIAEFPVNGDMALRLGWKAEREFIAAVGGCNPATQPPPDFPTLNRLAISLSSSDKFTFTLQAYFATTSNTIQFGAKAHLLADTGQARLDGMMSFDALIHTHPLGLEVDFAAAVTVRIDGNQLLAVTVVGQLTGPSPWQISGQASVHLFFISATVSFHFPLGSAAAPPLPAPVQVIDLLVTDVQQRANWSALPPPGETVVTLTSVPSSGTEMRAHPLGSLTVHQRTVPLGITIDKFGAADVAGPAKLALTSIIYGNSTVDPAAVTPVNDAFAPGQFLRLSDSDALSQPAFTTYQAGVAFTPADPSFDDLAVGDVAPVGYTVDFIDSHGQPPTTPLPPLDAQAAARLVPTAPAARAPTRTTGPRRYQGTPVGIAVNPRVPAGRQAP